MKINSIQFKNFRLFQQLEIALPDSNFIALVGINGSGKSSVLDGIAMCLAHITGQLSSPKNAYHLDYPLNLSDISNTHDTATMQLQLQGFEESIHIHISKEKNQRGNSYQITPKHIITEIKEQLKDQNIHQLPLFTYYNINRTAATLTSSNKRIKQHFTILNGYFNAFGKKDSTFKDFESWFIKEENLENEQKIESKNLDYESPRLHPIRKAIESFLSKIEDSQFHHLKGRRQSKNNVSFNNSVEEELVISKQDIEISINQLSSGEKAILLLVADIARRLAILNNFSQNSLLGKGIVLIDEIEMHLHPGWQRKIITGLRETFPNIQFIIATHSPQVLSKMRQNEVIFLQNEDYFSVNTSPKGRDSNGILEEIFEVDKRPKEVDNLIDQIFTAIAQNGVSIDTTDKDFSKLKKLVGENDPVLLRIKNLIKRKKILKN